jgi:diguanylate cyclase (GGDEF)-like protein
MGDIMIYEAVLTGILNSLIQNIILLFGLGFIFAAATPRTRKKLRIRGQFFIGLILGGIVFFIMLDPFVLDEGLIFDTRSILLSVTGLFFGAIPTSIAALVAIIYRLYIGGSGIYAGILTIVTSATIGLNWRYIRQILPKVPSYAEFYIMGVIVHVVTLLSFLAIPWPQAFDVIKSTALIYLLIFPVVTMLLAIVVNSEKIKFHIAKDLINQKVLLQASIDSTYEMEIFAVDLEYKYLSYNAFHKDSIKKFYDIDISKEMSFLDVVLNETIRSRLKNTIDRALSGESFKITLKVEDQEDSYLEERYAPIYDLDKNIVGATIFIQDITIRKQYENEILKLSYSDALTGLNNRRKHQEQLVQLNQEKYHPISVAFFDINGLKVMNDAFGHLEGDRLIKVVANKLLIACEKYNAYLSRMGGDEFIVLCPNTTEEEAIELANETKNLIEKEYIKHMAISISYGVSVKEINDDFEDVINQAETNLYKNKLYESSSHRNESIRTILNTLKAKDLHSEEHSKRVSDICKKMGKKMGMTKQDLEQLTLISNLHDIGKISIDDKILNKPGKLTEEEWRVMKRHPETGYRILSSSPDYIEIAEDILSHHERYDGTGYPRGLKGEEIPIRARIIAIADAYDAMTSDRPYRKKMGHDVAIKELIDNKGSQFDPKLVDLFLTIFSKKE